MAMAEAELQQAWRYEPKKSDPEEVSKNIFYHFTPDYILFIWSAVDVIRHL